MHNVFQRSTQYTPTVVLSEKATPNLKAENSFTSYTEGTVSIHSEGAYKSNAWVSFLNNFLVVLTQMFTILFVARLFSRCSENATGCSPEPLYQNQWINSSPVEEFEVQSTSAQKLGTYDVFCETEGGESANELDTDQLLEWVINY